MKMNHIRSRKPTEWPEPDRVLWETALTGSKLRRRRKMPGRRQPAFGWSAATRGSVEYAYGVYLHWYCAQGFDSLENAPIERVDADRIERFLAFYGPGRAPATIATTLRGIAYMLRATSPPDGLPWLTQWAHHLANTAQPSRPKLQRIAELAELHGMAFDLMTEASDGIQRGAANACVDFRDGLMVAMLAARPMRLRNFLALRLQDTFLINGDAARISFRATHTKTGRPIDWGLPEALLPVITHYLAEVRPILRRAVADPDEGWLWLSRRGRPLGATAASTRIATQTLQRLNRRVSPQLFRDCVATDIAVLDPEHVGITMPILGHARLSTSQKYYNQARSLTACRRHGAVIQNLRSD